MKFIKLLKKKKKNPQPQTPKSTHNCCHSPTSTHNCHHPPTSNQPTTTHCQIHHQITTTKTEKQKHNPPPTHCIPPTVTANPPPTNPSFGTHVQAGPPTTISTYPLPNRVSNHPKKQKTKQKNKTTTAT